MLPFFWKFAGKLVPVFLLAFAVPAWATHFVGSDIRVGIVFSYDTDNRTITVGPLLSNQIADFSHDQWHASITASIHAPIVGLDLSSMVIRNAIGTVEIGTMLHVSPPNGLFPLLNPYFEPSGQAGVTLTLGNGDPTFDYNAGIYLRQDRFGLGIELPVSVYRFNDGTGSRLNYLTQSIDLSGSTSSCSPSLGGGANLSDCTLDQVVYTAISSTTPLPEPSTWTSMIAGLALLGAALRQKLRFDLNTLPQRNRAPVAGR